MGEMGLSPETFWKMTLAEFDYAYTGYKNRERTADYRAGQIVVALLEPHRDSKKRSKAFTPDEFFPSLRGLFAEIRHERTQSVTEQIAIMQAHTLALAHQYGVDAADVGL